MTGKTLSSDTPGRRAIVVHAASAPGPARWPSASGESVEVRREDGPFTPDLLRGQVAQVNELANAMSSNAEALGSVGDGDDLNRNTHD